MLPYQLSKTQVNTITWSLLESDVNITSDTTYCIILALLRKTLKCFLITNQTEYKIIILSFKTINNHASPLFPSMSLHMPYLPSKPTCHHSPNVSHALPHPSLFSGCSLYLEPLHLEEVFPALGVFPTDLSTELPPVVTILPQLRCYLPRF